MRKKTLTPGHYFSRMHISILMLSSATGNFPSSLTVLKYGLGLIDPAMARKVANAYRHFRRKQHQLRLQGEEQARVDMKSVAEDIAELKQLGGHFQLSGFATRSSNMSPAITSQQVFPASRDGLSNSKDIRPQL
jgi:hypothetical protein